MTTTLTVQFLRDGPHHTWRLFDVNGRRRVLVAAGAPYDTELEALRGFVRATGTQLIPAGVSAAGRVDQVAVRKVTLPLPADAAEDIEPWEQVIEIEGLSG